MIWTRVRDRDLGEEEAQLPFLNDARALLSSRGGNTTRVVGIYADKGNIQRLGECIGKGAFGAVYKAFNWGTGEAVAVKQIKTADLPKSELRMIEVC